MQIRNVCATPCRYFSAATILPRILGWDGIADYGMLLLHGGKDDWRRLDDLWRLQLKSLQVSTSVLQKGQNIGASGKVVWHSTRRPDSLGSWELAEAGRNERCSHVLGSGTARVIWTSSCGMGAEGGGDGSCTMGMVLDMAWCSGEYQVVGSP